MKCPYCNTNIKKAKFCPDCGKEIETGLSEEQKRYLIKKKRAHEIGAVAGSVVGGAGLGLGAIGVTGGVILIILGILLSLTGIGAILGIPMIIIGIIALAAGGTSAVAGAASTGAAIHSAKKGEEIDDKLHGVKK